MGNRGRGSQSSWALPALSAATLLLLVLLTPQALAAERASGVLDIQGPIDLSNVEEGAASAVFGFLARDLSAGFSLEVVSRPDAKAEFCLLTKKYAYVGGPLPATSLQTLPMDRDCRIETNLKVASEGTAGGTSFVGFYSDMMNVTLAPTGRVKGEFWNSHRLASHDVEVTSVSTSDRDHLYYVVDVNVSHVVVTAQGRMSGTLSGSVKILGLPVHVAADSGERSYVTGQERPQGPAGEETVRWAFATFQDAEFTLESKAPVLAAVEELSARGSGELSFRATGGTLVSAEATYAPRRAAVDEIAGTFSAVLTPREGADRAGRLLLEGSVVSTSMTRVPVPPGSSASAAEISPLVIVGAVVGGGAVLVGGAFVYRRRMTTHARVRPSHAAVPTVQHMVADGPQGSSLVLLAATGAGPTVEECLDRVALAVEVEDWRSAAHWMRVARRVDPKPEYLRAEAAYLARLGDVEAAMAACAEAAHLGDKQALVDAAAWAMQAADAQQALAYLRDALAANPHNLDEIEHDGTFRALRDDPAFEQLVKTARERLDREARDEPSA